ncbi:MAG: adenosylcobinamide-GDP ribazoletransferase, partial [Candidatus Binataceae bacterium]
ALVFSPLIGIAFGIALASLDRALAPLFGAGVRSVVTLLIAVIVTGGFSPRGIADLCEAVWRGARQAPTGLARIGPLGLIAAVAWFAISASVLSVITLAAARTSALVMAMLLSRWSLVPAGYGLNVREHWGLGVPFEGGIKFREFAVSSVVALGLVMGMYANVGIVAIVAAALTILGLRLLAIRRLGGASGYVLAGGCATIEAVVLAVAALLTA